jgi:hypothetical protein
MAGKKLKIVIIVVVVIVALFFIAALASGPYINKDVEAIQGIDQFVVLEQGSQYVARFSLVDAQMGPAAADVNVNFRVGNHYEDNFNVNASEFGTYQLQLTGQEFVAYAWTLPSGFSITEPTDTAVLTVTLPDGREFKADTTVF